MTKMTQTQHTALVTGGRRGIGAAIVAELANAGCRILSPSREELDLSNPNAVNAFSHQLESGESDVDILVNNAGINIIEPFTEVSPNAWETTMQVNLHAPMRLMQAAANSMQRRGWGRIVNISSIFGVITREQRAVYTTTKTALAGLTRTAAIELAKHDVLVNCVAPGYVETELTRQNNSPEDLKKIAHSIPIGRLAQPREIAKLVSFLCSQDNTYITGQVIIADGGFTCI